MKKKIKINDMIFEKIKFRYHFMEENYVRGRATAGKLLLDSFYPRYVANAMILNQDDLIYNTNTIRKGYCISEQVSQDLAARQLHISELVAMLGYTKTDISKLLQAVKNKNLSCTLVGLGGTGSNFLHWMYEMSEWTGKDSIFNTMLLFDDDKYDIPNMLRIPFIPSFEQNKITAHKTSCMPPKFRTLATYYYLYTERITTDSLKSKVTNRIEDSHFIYGAPNITTRADLSAGKYTFFAATHRDDEYSIVENPTVDDELMMETYGKINLSMFFLNHLSMTLDFLTYLKSRETGMGTKVENNEIVRKDFTAEFDTQIVNGFKAGSKKLFAIHANEINTVELNLTGVE